MSSAPESSQNHQQKEKSDEVRETRGTMEKFYLQSARVDNTRGEIKRMQKVIQKMMARRRDWSSCPAEHQQNIELDSEWLNTITKTVTDYGSILHPNEGPPIIYRVDGSDKFLDRDRDAYCPALISIGPYTSHRYIRASETMQNHKWRCVNKLIVRQHQLDGSNDTRALVEKCLVAMKALESKVRSCYSEKITADSEDLALMMMLDGCFILCLLLNQDDDSNDFKDLEDSQIRGNLWIWQMVKYDLLLLENQIPLFIIEKLFYLLGTPGDLKVNLVSRALRLFSDLDPHWKDDRFTIPSHQVHHLLHLFYLSITPCQLSIKQSTPSSLTPNWIPSAMELQDAGVKFKKKKKKNALCFLDINFSKGIMHIPTLEIHDFSIKLFRNLIAFEQCYPDTQCHITNYAVFMDCVINTKKDVRLLHLNGILKDRTGADQGANVFFRRLCKGIHYASDKNYLSSVYIDVTKYQGSNWHKWRAVLARDYFNNPWAAISVGAAVVLLLLTILQTFFTVYPYFKPKN